MITSMNAIVEATELPDALIYRYPADDDGPAHQIPVLRPAVSLGYTGVILALGQLEPAQQVRYLRELADVATQLADEVEASGDGPVDPSADWRSERRLSTTRPEAPAGAPDQEDVDAVRGLLDLMQDFGSNDQRARYLLSSKWLRDRGAAASARIARWAES